jgi:tetrahydromethanopterin S-methyltransferase subunit D
VLLAVCAGMGWLYLLRQAGALDAGPRLSGALPLEQLARGDDQPLLRVAVAWVPAGVAAGVALAWATGWGRGRRALAVGLLGLVVLFAKGAVSDAVAVNETVASKLGDQISHGGIWLEVACLVIGSLLIGRWSSAGSRGSEPVASRT